MNQAEHPFPLRRRDDAKRLTDTEEEDEVLARLTALGHVDVRRPGAPRRPAVPPQPSMGEQWEGMDLATRLFVVFLGGGLLALLMLAGSLLRIVWRAV